MILNKTSFPPTSNRTMIPKLFSTFIILSISLGGVSCSSAPKKPTPIASPNLSQRLPKPAPMRVAKDDANRRNAPKLPNITVNIPTESEEEAARIAAETPADTKETISQTDPKFINNEQPQDFFQGVGDAPAGQALFGPAFDSMFTPPTPANQPVSSTSYEQLP
jgi:hypothetical protein